MYLGIQSLLEELLQPAIGDHERGREQALQGHHQSLPGCRLHRSPVHAWPVRAVGGLQQQACTQAALSDVSGLLSGRRWDPPPSLGATRATGARGDRIIALQGPCLLNDDVLSIAGDGVGCDAARAMAVAVELAIMAWKRLIEYLAFAWQSSC